LNKLVWLGLLLLGQFPLAYAQKEAAVWYFGENAGLDFNSGAPLPLTDGALSTHEGCASIADSTGRLLFYTDGMSVWNREHQLMANGTGLLGSYTATQSALIVPQPGSNSRYYIFTVSAQADYLGECNCAAYSVVDLSRQNGLGAVTQKNVVLYQGTTEKLAAVHHANGEDIWVVSHGWHSNAFYAYRVSRSGVSEPVISRTGTVHTQEPFSPNDNTAGQMKLSPDGTRLGLVIQNMALAELFRFDNRTGIVTDPLTLSRSVFEEAGFLYGLEFSPNSEYLYISARRDIDILYQFSLRAESSRDIIASKEKVGISNTSGFFALQLGPDKRIYVVTSAGHGLYEEYLSVLEKPDEKGTASRFVSDAVFLGGGKSIFGLPGFIASYFRPPDPLLVMPNVITPNGDAYNERFVPIQMQHIRSASVRICNRWGEVVHRSDTLAEGWTGEGYSSGVYYWLVNYEGTNGQTGSRKGILTILR
jgi:gliding motility-associated-like protein